MRFRNLRYEHKIVLSSILTGIAIWTLDALVDSGIFSRKSFLDSLILHVSPHELYFRLLMVLTIVVFSIAISGVLARRRIAEEDLRRALAAIEDEKARSEAIIAAIPDGISIQDRDFRVLYQNEVHRAMVGDQIGKRCYEKYAGLDSVCPGCPVALSFRDGGRHVLEKSRVSAAGTSYIEISSAALRNAKGEIVAGIEAVREVTARKRTEEELLRHRERLAELVAERTAELEAANERLQQEIVERERMESELSKVQKMESISLLAGGIAHDFNNLLGSVIGNLSLALHDLAPDDAARRQLENAERAALRAQDLTRQLLTFSRGGAPVKKTIALGAVLTEAAGFSLLGSRVLHEIRVPKDLWPVDADEGQMMQVFNNLLLNADQAMTNGGVVRISAENIVLGENQVPPLRAGRYVKIEFRDEGTGIPPEHLGRIFDPYFTTKQKGSGLGLAATYAIIRKHDGYITARSELGKGSIFHVYLPASTGVVRPAAREAPSAGGNGRVLIMDDEEDMRTTTGDMLKRLGYTVDFAREGGEAVEKYRTEAEAGRPFDVVLMDLTVPGGMGGKEAVRKLLEIDPRARAIVSSGYSQDPVMADFREYGFRDVVVKPYRLRELSEVMARVMNG